MCNSRARFLQRGEEKGMLVSGKAVQTKEDEHDAAFSGFIFTSQ